MSKRLLLARTLKHLGILHLLEMYRSKPGLLIINHHRIGDPVQSSFDRKLFSATVDEFDTQLKYLKKHFEIVSGEQLQDIVSRKAPLKRMHVALTFDDGYLDNYTRAYPVLLANECSATFFLIPQFVGSAHIPWWDEIAYLVRNTRKQKITLTTPGALTITLGPDREAAIHQALVHYKRHDNLDEAAFMAELREQAGCVLPHSERRFLNWDEAREMKGGGMTIGSHTQSHPILAHISPQRQRWELEHSKQVIEENLGSPISSLAYPVGTRGGFDASTEELARSLGYTLCFSFYGGVNTLDSMNPSNLLRGSTSSDPELFRTETMMLAKWGRLPH